MKVRKPILPKRNVNTDTISLAGEPALQVGANAVEHLEFELVLQYVILGGKPDVASIMLGSCVAIA